MQLSEKQSIMLFEIAKDCTNIAGGRAGFSSDTILKLVNDIINQQSDNLVELDDESNTILKNLDEK